MPYRKYKKKTYKKKRNRLSPSMYRAVNQIINRKIEKKYVDTIGDRVTVGHDLPIMTKLTSVVTGTGDASQRIGDEVELVGLHAKIACHADTVEDRFRVILFQWKDDDASGGPVAANILQSGAGVLSYASPYDHDNGAQYSIICDKWVNAVPGQSNEWRLLQCTLNLNKTPYGFEKKIHYNVGGNSGKNNLYILVTTAQAVASGSECTYYVRVTYRDG